MSFAEYESYSGWYETYWKLQGAECSNRNEDILSSTFPIPALGCQYCKAMEQSQQAVRNDNSSESSSCQPTPGSQTVDVNSGNDNPNPRGMPVGVFWDIENCSVPSGKSALQVVQVIREIFIAENREAEFMCACDTHRESRTVIQELNQAQINVVHVDAVSKNAADDKIRQTLRRFSDSHNPPASIVLISSDINFSTILYDLRYRKNLKITLVHGDHVHESLVACAHHTVNFHDLVSHVQARLVKECSSYVCVTVTGYGVERGVSAVRKRLRHLVANTGGRVVSVNENQAIIRFPSLDHAHRGRHRMQGQDVYGSAINVEYTHPSYHYGSYYNQNRNNNNNWNNKTNTNNGYYNGNNVSPNRTRPYSQSYRQTPPMSETQQGPVQPKADIPSADLNYPTSNTDLSNRRHEYQSPALPHFSANQNGPSATEGDEHKEVNLLDTLLRGGTEGSSQDDHSTALQGLVKKFAEGNKSSRQMLMLQQQIYQEEQMPLGGGDSTQFYSHYTQYQQTHFLGYQSWQQQQQQQQQEQEQSQQQNGYYDNYRNSYQSQGPPQRGFQPIRSASPSESSLSSASPVDFNSEEFPGAVDLLISNLDYNISPREWKHILTSNFHPHIKILHIDVYLQPDNTSLGVIKVGSMEEARFAISQFHRKKIGYKRIHVTLRTDTATTPESSVRSEAIALLSEAKDNVLPLFKFIELFNKRFNRSVSVSELYKMRDTIEIVEKGGAGRMIHLAPGLKRATPEPSNAEDTEVQQITEVAVCHYHCPEGSSMYKEAVNMSILPNVKVQLKTFAPQVHSLLMSHDGLIPLMSFPACFSAEITQLVYVYEGGVPLEHVISCVPGVQIVTSNTGLKKVIWAENKPPGSPEPGSPGCNGSVSHHLSQFGREMVDLLKSQPSCRLAFSKFIPSYHQHFGRQLRVADYGYSRLGDLFDAIPHVIQMIGMGDRKVLSLAHKTQVKRFTADLLKLLKNAQGRQVYLSDLTEEFCKLFNRSWDVVEYGICHLDDMLSELPPNTVQVTSEGHNTVIALPRVEPTDEELERIKQFSLEIVDLLKHSDHCRMPFTKLVPSYHHHFGRQLRVGDYGYTKLQDLLESLSNVVELDEEVEERMIRLTESELRKVVGDQVVAMLKEQRVHCCPLDQLTTNYQQMYGFPLPLADLHVETPQQLATKLKHVVKLEVYDGREYLVLSDRTSAPPLARQVLQLLMDQSGGSLPLMELCSRYKTTFGAEPNITKIKEELLDYVQISGDDESGVISLTPLQTLARDLRTLLQIHGKITLSHLERLFYKRYCVELKPALYGFQTTVALLMAIPHVVTIKGKGNRRMVHLSGDLQGTLPIIDESYSSRPDSDTPSNDSGSALTDDDTPTELKSRPQDLLDEHVPFGVPSPALKPDSMGSHIDLIKFDINPEYADSIFASISEEDRGHQKTPLCQTPTSQLLQLAAQFLPQTPPPDEPLGPSPTPQSTLEILKQGWWSASPSQLQEVSASIKNAGIVDQMAAIKLIENKSKENMEGQGENEPRSKESQTKTDNLKKVDSRTESAELSDDETETSVERGQDHRCAIQSLSATLAYLRETSSLTDHIPDGQSTGSNRMNAVKVLKRPESPLCLIEKDDGDKIKAAVKIKKEKLSDDEDTEKSVLSPPLGAHPLQPGSYWYSKQFKSKTSSLELPSKSPEDVRKVLASLALPKSREVAMDYSMDGNSREFEAATPHASIDNSDTLTDGFPDFSSEVINVDYSALVKDSKQYNNNPTTKADSERIIPGKTTKHDLDHKFGNCFADDCMCYEVVFRQDQPIETSSIKSDSSFTTESPEVSPTKSRPSKQRLSTSPLSDESGNSSINKRRSRIAAKFGQLVE
ncbi:meiosis regulator and mRNA stability factor 1-like isoform X2 [Mya arenaria]|uniref:meiosis regulator and mRNA stability factor 1-like isoform X2 n=1 Tax=Mya arenaria TaxID=6604 RepID=UPI0022DF1641|nr:meiosis regulator and mRNA stability factor 1-like isoform X2 [Mya arenaria]